MRESISGFILSQVRDIINSCVSTANNIMAKLTNDCNNQTCMPSTCSHDSEDDFRSVCRNVS